MSQCNEGKQILDKTHNAKLGIVSGLVNKVITLLLPFVVRTILIRVIGIEYAGLNSLFVSLLQVLNLAELGFSNAVVFSMYKPIVEKDNDTICALLAFYRRVYKIVGVVVLVAGVIAIPFLPYLINGNPPDNINLYVVYVIFLVNSSISYLLYGYKTSILNAYQKTYVINNISSITQLLLNIFSIVVLLVYPNYYLYILIIPIFTVINNVLVSVRVDKMYPQYRCYGQIKYELRKDIGKRIFGLAIQRLCVMTRNSLSSIVLSAFISLSMVGIYNNYYMIMSSLTGVINIILTAILAGVGNDVQVKSKEENFTSMRKFNFLYMWIGAYTAICLIYTYQPFMKIWMGDDYMLPASTVFLLGLFYYNLKLGDISSTYYSAAGLWWYGKWRSILEAALNLILNIIFVQLWGVNGIILATLLVHFFINILYGTSILFKYYFGYKYMWKYFLIQVYFILTTIAICAIVYFIINGIERTLSISSDVLVILERLIICTLFVNPLLFLCYYKTDDYKWAKEWVINTRRSQNNGK